MPELHVPSDVLVVRVSPSLAMALTLPMAELAPRFPGVDPWLAQLPARLGRAARADLRLLCVPLSGALSYLFEVPDAEDSAEPALEALSAASPDEILSRVLLRLAAHSPGLTPDMLRQWLVDEPERIAALIDSIQLPNPDEAFPVDTERVLSLLRQPAALKAMVEWRLRQFWFDHLALRWREALPTCRALAQAAERQFALGDPERVLAAVAGRKGQESYATLAGKRLVFVPVPFLGPYVAIATLGDWPIAYIGFGLVQGQADGVGSLRDLLAVLKALGEEARLQAIAYIRERGEARALDFMQRFGWSQPATSRHLRALESVGLLRSEWADGVKRYTIDHGRARAIARSLERFLAGD